MTLVSYLFLFIIFIYFLFRLGWIQDFRNGVRVHRAGSFSTFYMIFHKLSHEIELILSNRMVRVSPLY